MNTLSAKILVSKLHSPIKGTRAPVDVVDSRAGVGKIQYRVEPES